MFDNVLFDQQNWIMEVRTRRMETMLAHTFGMIFSVLIFSVYTLGRGGAQADWVQVAATLLLFGVVYEILSWLFFNLFNYFAARKTVEGDVVTVSAGEPSQNIPKN